jgi:hypothetical protein
MSKEVADITAKGFEKIQAKIARVYREKGMKASGNFEEQLEIVKLDKGAKLMGVNYTRQLEYGRQPTSAGASAGNPPLIEMIKQWIKDKGIVATDITESQLAWAITTKIHKEGWDRKNHGGLKLVTDSITIDDFQPIIQEVLKLEIEKFKQHVITILTKEN